MLPDDCGECRVCGIPVYGGGSICLDCEPVRDNHGRFVKREVADQYRAVVKRWLYGATQEDRDEGRRQWGEFWAT